MKDVMGDRMKRYEDVSHIHLPRRIPVIIRIDGKNFSSLTRKLYGRNWDVGFSEHMKSTVDEVLQTVQGCKLAYCQSDEVSLLLTDYRTVNTEPWFDYDVQKMSSVVASAAAGCISLALRRNACFDGRSFSVPHDDVCNYFIWRQRDAIRNAILNLGQRHLGRKTIYRMNTSEITERLIEEGYNFDDYTLVYQRGFCFVDGELDDRIPLFTEDRDYIERHVYIRED